MFKLTIQGHRRPSRLPDELEKKIFELAALDAGAIPNYLLVAKRVHHWLEPYLYCSVTIRCPYSAQLFVSALRAHPRLACNTVKTLCLGPLVPLEEGAKILSLCEVVESLTLRIPVNRPDEQNPLIEPLNRLCLTHLSLDLSSIFFNPSLRLSDNPIFTRVLRLHISNAWVLMRGVALGIQQLHQLTHLSLHTRFTSMDMDIQTLQSILGQCPCLQVLLLWAMEYEDCAQVREVLYHGGLKDHRIVVFNVSIFHALPKNGTEFWSEAEEVVVRQREE